MAVLQGLDVDIITGGFVVVGGGGGLQSGYTSSSLHRVRLPASTRILPTYWCASRNSFNKL
jgi:hypothetical protein